MANFRRVDGCGLLQRTLLPWAVAAAAAAAGGAHGLARGLGSGLLYQHPLCMQLPVQNKVLIFAPRSNAATLKL